MRPSKSKRNARTCKPVQSTDVAILGVDVGGTFTDAVLVEEGRIRTAKVPTASQQEESVIDAARAVGAAAGVTRFAHLLHLRRQTRAHLYRLCAEHPEPLVPLERCYGVRGRLGPDGELEPLDLDSLPDLADAQAVAVCLLFAFRDPSHEQAVADELR